MCSPVSDAIVFFGATGDLAYKQIFLSLQGLVRDEGLNVPIIGVAKAGWSLDQLKARARDSLSSHSGLDPKAFAKLTSLLRYVDGDYNDPSTYARLRQELDDAKRPLHYLAIPPSLFATVAEGLAKLGAGMDARLVVEKPFGRDRESARQLDRILNRYAPPAPSAIAPRPWPVPRSSNSGLGFRASVTMPCQRMGRADPPATPSVPAARPPDAGGPPR